MHSNQLQAFWRRQSWIWRWEADDRFCSGAADRPSCSDVIKKTWTGQVSVGIREFSRPAVIYGPTSDWNCEGCYFFKAPSWFFSWKIVSGIFWCSCLMGLVAMIRNLYLSEELWYILMLH